MLRHVNFEIIPAEKKRRTVLLSIEKQKDSDLDDASTITRREEVYAHYVNRMMEENNRYARKIKRQLNKIGTAFFIKEAEKESPNKGVCFPRHRFGETQRINITFSLFGSLILIFVAIAKFIALIIAGEYSTAAMSIDITNTLLTAVVSAINGYLSARFIENANHAHVQQTLLTMATQTNKVEDLEAISMSSLPSTKEGFAKRIAHIEAKHRKKIDKICVKNKCEFFALISNGELIYKPILDEEHSLYQAVSRYLGETEPNIREEVLLRILDEPSVCQMAIERLNSEQTLEDCITSIRTGVPLPSNLETLILARVLGRPILLIGRNGDIVNQNDMRDFLSEPIFVYFREDNVYDAFVLSEVVDVDPRQVLRNLETFNEDVDADNQDEAIKKLYKSQLQAIVQEDERYALERKVFFQHWQESQSEKYIPQQTLDLHKRRWGRTQRLNITVSLISTVVLALLVAGESITILATNKDSIGAQLFDIFYILVATLSAGVNAVLAGRFMSNATSIHLGNESIRLEESKQTRLAPIRSLAGGSETTNQSASSTSTSIASLGIFGRLYRKVRGVISNEIPSANENSLYELARTI